MGKIWGFGITAAVFFSVVWLWTRQIENELGVSSIISGWALFAILVSLALYNLRKRLPFLPLASSSRWFLFHTVGGFLAVSLFWLHTGISWPAGFYNQVLALIFYAVSLSGVIGLIIEKVYPRFLTQSGDEYIYERIPSHIAEIRKKAEDLVIECTEKTGSDTLAQHYMDTLHWFFQRPRFFMNHVLRGQGAQIWVQQQCSLLERYLNVQEQTYLNQIFALADTKRKIDLHYSVQTLLKGWLLVHVPLSAAVMALVVWHMIVIQVYFQ
jgi:hypothetical protein